MGSDYPVCSLLGSDPDGDYTQSNRFAQWWDSKFIPSMADLNVKAGTWKDQFGEEGHGPIEAYVMEPDGQVELIFGFKVLLVQGPSIPGGDENPRVIQFRAEPTLSDGKVIFHGREYTERGRESVNNTVKHCFAVSKAREDAGIPTVFSSL